LQRGGKYNKSLSILVPSKEDLVRKGKGKERISTDLRDEKTEWHFPRVCHQLLRRNGVLDEGVLRKSTNDELGGSRVGEGESPKDSNRKGVVRGRKSRGELLDEGGLRNDGFDGLYCCGEADERCKGRFTELVDAERVDG
jgi:hypothetical protein